MDICVNKSTAKGVISAPPSKSLAHRYIICAALSEGESIISNVDFSEDIKATMDSVNSLGAKTELIDASTVRVEGIGENFSKKSLDIYCRESGSTMRFFMGIAFGYGVESKFYGSTTLRNRPFSVYETICKEQNIVFERKEDHIFLHGKIKAGNYDIPGNISSQFITGLMFSLARLDDDSVINLIPPVESRSYIDLTIQAMKMFGVEVDWSSDTALYIKGNQKYVSRSVTVEGDYSNAAFLDAFNLIGGDVCVENLNSNSLQGDRVYKEYFKALKSGKPTLDISDCPDLGPILFAMAAACNGGVFTGTKRLKIKESDRGTVMCAELEKFGVKSCLEENTIEIFKSDLITPSSALSGHNDHRIVMSLSLLLSVTGGKLEGAEAVRKSYPGFFDDIIDLGIEVDRDGMDQ